MNFKAASTTFVTNDVNEAVRFYETHFSAVRTFDSGWYIMVRFPGEELEVGFMEPQNGAPTFSGGATLNLMTDAVDEAHERLIAGGVTVAIPLDDHPWGDRGFGVVDPVGVMVYVYKEITPADDHKSFYLLPSKH